MSGPCIDSWPLVSCAPNGECSHLANLDPDHQEVIKAAAIEYLWRWTGRRFGLCPVSIRPCSEDCNNLSPYTMWRPGGGLYPYIQNGNWYNAVCGRCGTGRCACAELSSIKLPGPVDSIVEILIDGEVLAPSAYRLDGNTLLRVDGQTFPKCQNMAHDPTESATDPSNTFLVTFMQGEAVPAAGRLAAGTFACELAKRACGDKTCRLPKRATMVVREGTTIMMPDDSALFTNGSVGLDEVDWFLASVQHDSKQGFRVTSVDSKRYRVR